LLQLHSDWQGNRRSSRGRRKVCFGFADFGLRVDENNEIQSFFLPSLIVKSCKSTVRLCDSFTVIDKASGEQKKLKKKKRKEKKKSLFLLCGF
jgi:hypothetical protein